MYRTIAIGEYQQIQGVFRRYLDDGKAVVSVGSVEYVGTLIPSVRSESAPVE